MKVKCLIAMFMLAAVFALVAGVQAQDNPAGKKAPEVINPMKPSEGMLLVVSKDGATKPFPLKHTDVKAEISGMITSVTVTQQFHNPYKEKIEAIYTFPLPPECAVNDMTMLIGERVIKGVIRKREEAKQIYEQAKAAGKVASLLDQERPNIFTQSVANIDPGKEIKITISYIEVLKYDKGTYDFNFPMVVGPRYIPEGVPDAEKIAPPVIPQGMRTGTDISLTVTLDAGIPIQDIRSTSHEFTLEKDGPNKAKVTLSPKDNIPNKDFVLRYNVAGEQPEMGLLTHRSKLGGFFMLMIQPQAKVDIQKVTGKEMVFVLDTSGSMHGYPIETSKRTMLRCLEGMNPQDTFQILRFANDVSGIAEKPLPNNDDNRNKGIKFVKEMNGGGGTDMILGIRGALDFQRDPERLRTVFIMTDGYIGNEAQILAAIQDKLGESRLFSLGVGTSVNHYLLDNMAEVGRGAVQYVNLNEDPTKVVERFYERIRYPYLTDISIDWKGLEVSDVYPKKIPDMFHAQPVIVIGYFKKAGNATIELKGKIAGKEYIQKIPVVFPENEPKNESLGTLWARARIKDASNQMYGGEKKELVEEITNIALEFRLMSQYTSFVAVDEITKTVDGKAVTVQQPVEMPKGVSYEGVFGDSPKAEMMMKMKVSSAPGQYAGAATGAASPSADVYFKARDGMAAGKVKDKRATGEIVKEQGKAPQPVPTVVPTKDWKNNSDKSSHVFVAAVTKVVEAKKGSGTYNVTMQIENVLKGTTEEKEIEVLFSPVNNTMPKVGEKFFVFANKLGEKKVPSAWRLSDRHLGLRPFVEQELVELKAFLNNSVVVPEKGK